MSTPNWPMRANNLDLHVRNLSMEIIPISAQEKRCLINTRPLMAVYSIN